MGKAVLISIQPKWCEKIVRGRKTLELRKTAPRLKTPFKCYIYCTKSNPGWFNMLHMERLDGKIIGEFVCDYILRHCEMANADIAEQLALIKREKIFQYANGKEVFGLHISDLVVYDKPKELGAFKQCHICEYMGVCNDKCCWKPLMRPPQSWCYVEELLGGRSNGD